MTKSKLKFLVVLFLVTTTNGLLAERYISRAVAGTAWGGGLVFKGDANIVHHPTNSFSWSLNENGAGDGISVNQTQNEIAEAYALWQSVTTSTLTFTYDNLTTVDTWGNDGTNVHFWAEDGDPAFNSTNPLYSAPGTPLNMQPSAITVFTINANQEILDVDILYNGRKAWTIGSSWNMIEAIALHEIGHSFGMHHTDLPGLTPTPVMAQSPGAANNNLQHDDDEGVSFLYGGNIIDNTTLSGTDEYNWDINVVSGNTLTINSGSTINMFNGSKIIVDGTLDVNGTSSSLVTIDFQSSNSSNGIWLEDNSHADIDYADIKDGTYGIRSSKADLKIENSDVYGVSYGLYLVNHNSTTYEAEILNNDISAGFNYCIYLYNSDGQIRNNDIHGGSRGIYCSTTSSPDLGQAGYFGLNTIRNTGYGVRAYDYSDPFLGKYNCVEQGGLNSFLNCSSYFIYAESNCDIDAENNWFGSDPPTSSKIYASSNSTVNYDPWHHSAPLLKVAKSASPEEELFDQKIFNNITTDSKIDGKKYHYNPNWPIKWKLLYVRNLIFVNDLGFAKTICKSIINEYPDSSLSINAMNLLRKASRNDQENFKDFLRGQLNLNMEKEIYGYIELMLNKYESKSSNVLASFDNTISKYESANLRESALFQKFMYAYHDMEDREAAIQISDQLDMEYPKSESTFEAHIILDDGKVKFGEEPNNGLIKKISDEEDVSISGEYQLFGNYPNPFNPSTTIRYSTPFVSNISLKIYDISGRLVKSFESNSQSAGNHEFVWNGTNELENKVSSGIYFYKLKALSLEGNGKVFEKTSKLSLMK